MPLHVDLRPSNFAQFVGNKAMVESLIAVLDQADRPHTYLFSGPSGCGKTTLARIVAKSIGCDDREIMEINMSNNRGIDTAREIIDSMKYAPLVGQVKVFVLDECHKATSDFQNALLKAFEEPPVHVYFLLCTTEPEKLIPTIRNRCSTFVVSKLASDKMAIFLKRICRSQQINISEDALQELVREAEGCPRKALIILDQIKTLPENSDVFEAIRSAKIEETKVIDLCRALIQQSSWSEVAKIIETIETDDWEKIRRVVLGYCAAVLLKKQNNQAAIVLDCFKEPFFNTGKAGLVSACYEAIIG